VSPRIILCIAKGVWLEAIRRKEIYVIVSVGCLMILAFTRIRFFGLDGLSKFHRETALNLMSMCTALTVVILASRQLPLEFTRRTIYPLLARPVPRGGFVLGKWLGVVSAGLFCLLLFLGIYLIACLVLGAPLHATLLLQHTWLQLCMVMVMTSICFWLSMLCDFDAAVTFGILFYFTSTVFSNFLVEVHAASGPLGQTAAKVLNVVIPHLSLFNLSQKVVHGDFWPPLSAGVMLQLSLYGGIFALIFLGGAWLQFRRRAL